MVEEMPLDKFRDMKPTELEPHQEIFNLITQHGDDTKFYPENSKEGYIFCAKLEFSDEVQAKLLSYPLAPEALIVEEDMISEGQRKTWNHLFGKAYFSTNHKKMVNCFKEKKCYTSHYKLLAFLAKLGVKVTLIRGYSFHQERFISSYVSFCAAQRKLSTNPADKNLWKLMANIIYGKVIN